MKLDIMQILHKPCTEEDILQIGRIAQIMHDRGNHSAAFGLYQEAAGRMRKLKGAEDINTVILDIYVASMGFYQDPPVIIDISDAIGRAMDYRDMNCDDCELNWD